MSGSVSGRPLVEKISRREPSSSAEAPSPYTDDINIDIDMNDTDGHRTERAAGQEAAAAATSDPAGGRQQQWW